MGRGLAKPPRRANAAPRQCATRRGIGRPDLAYAIAAGVGGNPRHGVATPATDDVGHGRAATVNAPRRHRTGAAPSTDRFWLAVGGVLLLALLFRLGLLSLDAFPFNSDEAIVGLMARHILAGSWPTFFYGQAYLGSLDAGLVAAAFAAFGESVASIRLVQTFLFLAMILTTMLLARAAGLTLAACGLAGALLAVPPVNVTLYTTVSLGGYGEALVLGNLILLLTLRMLRQPGSVAYHVAWGALAGFSLWVFGLTVVYMIPAGAALVASVVAGRRATRAVALLAAMAFGAGLGAAPMLAWALRHGGDPLVSELLGAAIAGASPASLPAAVAGRLANLLLFGPTVVFGLRPPWSLAPLGMPLTPVAGILWVIVLFFGIRRGAWPVGVGGRNLLLGVCLTLIVGFVLTPFGADPSGRYFLPLAVPLSIVAGAGVSQAVRSPGRRWLTVCAAVLLGFHLATNLLVAISSPGFTTQFDATTVYDHAFDDDLVAFLLERGETSGYTTYWVSYPLAFLSAERLVYVPHLPYHSDFRYTSRDDRYPPYRQIVAADSSPAYVTARQPWLDEALRRGLARLDVSFDEAAIGDFRVFYALSRTVRPAELGLGPEAVR